MGIQTRDLIKDKLEHDARVFTQRARGTTGRVDREETPDEPR